MGVELGGKRLAKRVQAIIGEVAGLDNRRGYGAEVLTAVFAQVIKDVVAVHVKRFLYIALEIF